MTHSIPKTLAKSRVQWKWAEMRTVVQIRAFWRATDPLSFILEMGKLMLSSRETACWPFGKSSILWNAGHTRTKQAKLKMSFLCSSTCRSPFHVVNSIVNEHHRQDKCSRSCWLPLDYKVTLWIGEVLLARYNEAQKCYSFSMMSLKLHNSTVKRGSVTGQTQWRMEMLFAQSVATGP
jgi:hypothetical protein